MTSPAELADRAKAWFKRLFAPRVTFTETVNEKPLSQNQREAFDRAFAKMDEAFAELDKVFHP